MPTRSQNGRSMIARPIDTIMPTISATTSWPRKKPPMARLSRRGDEEHLVLGRLGHEVLGHPPEVGEVDQQVEGDDRRQHEDERDVEDAEAELADLVELLVEGRVALVAA